MEKHAYHDQWDEIAESLLDDMADNCAAGWNNPLCPADKQPEITQ